MRLLSAKSYFSQYGNKASSIGTGVANVSRNNMIGYETRPTTQGHHIVRPKTAMEGGTDDSDDEVKKRKVRVVDLSREVVA